MRTPFVVIGVLIAVLIPIGWLTEEKAEPAPTPVATIAERVERLRGLRFRRVPVPRRVSADQAVEDGLADLDRRYPPAQRHADEAFYERLGLLPAGTDLKEVTGSIFGSEVAGYYDPATKRLKVVTGAATANDVMSEMILAHELDHALTDQAIGLDQERFERDGDPGLAYAALVEGAASALMIDYVTSHFRSDLAIGGLLSGSLAAGGTASAIPPFLLESLTFPYVRGLEFVQSLRERAGGEWTLVDLAERTRPPETTEQILHPQKWVDAEPPLPVSLPSPGPGWRRLTSGVFGEWQTGQLLARSGHAWAEPASGWGGDRYALYRQGEREFVVMRWRFDTPEDRDEFRAALADVPFDGEARVAEHDGRVTLTLFAR